MTAVPSRIGKFTIERILGQGAMGIVYQGFDPHIRRRVAIKTVRKDLEGRGGDAPDSVAARFRNEAQAVGRIQHPGVVAIYDFGEDEEQAYIAMEFVEGRNLEQVLTGTARLPEAQLLQIMDQLLDALGAAHAQGVWHRDIKPANLLITASGQVKLTDFGISRIAGMGLTQVAAMIGTPGYMSPEQFTGRAIDQRADIFACGVLLYRMLTGRPAFSGTVEQVMYQILHESPVPPSKLTLGRRPVVYDTIVARALAKKPDERYQGAAEFRRALAAGAAHDDATVIVPPGHWQRTLEAAVVAVPRAPSSGPGASDGVTQSAPPSGWDGSTLGRVERMLASHVGPMAKLMVRDAAKRCHDISSLVGELARHIGEDVKRQQFISMATSGTQHAPHGDATQQIASPAPPTPPASPGTERLAHDPLTEEFKARALQVLTRRLGPIAKVVVKRAAERAHGQAEFVDALLQAVDEGDRARLGAELKS